MQEIAFLSLRKSNIFWGTMPPDPPSQVYWSIKNPSYAPDSSCNRICRAQLFKAEIIENCYAFSNESGLNLSTLLQRKLCLSLAAALCAKISSEASACVVDGAAQ
jgi:hypothetical protein